MTSALEEIKQEIASRCNSHWSEKKRAYLLAQLGIDLRGKVSFIKKESGKKLVDFIREDMDGIVTLKSPEKESPIFGIFPVDVDVSAFDLPSLFEQPKRAASVRFNSRVWAAFSKPISSGCHRIFFKDSMYFDDSLIAINSDDNIIEIPPTLIVPEDAQNRIELISKNIVKWAGDNHLSLENILVTRSGKERHTSGEPEASNNLSDPENSEHSGSASLLDKIFQSLDRRELSRVSLPLDIVKRLMEIKP